MQKNKKQKTLKQDITNDRKIRKHTYARTTTIGNAKSGLCPHHRPKSGKFNYFDSSIMNGGLMLRQIARSVTELQQMS